MDEEACPVCGTRVMEDYLCDCGYRCTTQMEWIVFDGLGAVRRWQDADDIWYMWVRKRQRQLGIAPGDVYK